MENVESSAPVESNEAPAENVENSAENVENKSDATPEQKQQVAQMKEKFKIKVDGEEYEEEFDRNNDEEIIKHLQMSKAARKRMESAKKEAAEAKSLKAQAEQLIKMIQETPELLLEQLGEKGMTAAEKVLYKKIQAEMMSPEQRRVMELEAQLAKYMESEKKQKEEAEKSEMSAQEKQYQEHYQKLFIDAAEASGLPKTPSVIKRMAAIVKQSLELGIEMDAKDVAQHVKKQMDDEFMSIYGEAGLPIESLKARLGEKTVKALIKSELEQYKAASKVKAKSEDVEMDAPKNPTRPMSMEEWKEHINKRLAE